MRIRRLKLSGFKSFVEPSELRIEPGLTGVVGPNGCGKSNLLEAIRWVMGEGSPKSLRGGGMDDVIFAGTATRPPRDFAEVSILLERDARRRGAAGRERSHPADRARRRLGLPDRRARRPRQGRRPAVRRCRDRRAFAGAGQPGQDRLDHCGQAGRAPPDARGSGGHLRPSRAAQGRRAEAARDRGQSRAARRNPRRAGAARRRSCAGRRGRPSATAQLTDEIRSLEARLLHARWLEAERAAESGQRRGARGRGARSRRSRRRWPRRKARRTRPQRRSPSAAMRWREARDAGHEPGAPAGDRARAARHGRAPARGARPARRVARRRHRARGGAAGATRRARSPSSTQERGAIERRLSRRRSASPARIAAELDQRRGRVARGRGGAGRTARPPGGDARRAAGRRGRARSGAGPARAHRRRSRRGSASSSRRSATAASMQRARRSRGARRAGRGRSAGRGRDALAREAEQGARGRGRRARFRREQTGRGRGPLCPLRSPSMTRWPGRSNMAAARRSPASRAEPGYERALAAALGEDADAAIGGESPRRWQGSEIAAERSGASGRNASCLADHVKAPPELMRRLRAGRGGR